MYITKIVICVLKRVMTTRNREIMRNVCIAIQLLWEIERWLVASCDVTPTVRSSFWFNLEFTADHILRSSPAKPPPVRHRSMNQEGPPIHRHISLLFLHTSPSLQILNKGSTIYVTRRYTCLRQWSRDWNFVMGYAVVWFLQAITPCLNTKYRMRRGTVDLKDLSLPFFLEGSRSSSYGCTAAVRLTVQPCDEDQRWSVFFFIFPSNGAPVEWLIGENRSTRGKTCPSTTFSTTNPTWTDTESNPGLCGERPATNRLSHGTAYPRLLPVSFTMKCFGEIDGARFDLQDKQVFYWKKKMNP
jgi:hypothetical protein